KALSIAPTVSPAFERRATTYRKFRMRITGQVRGGFPQGLRCVPGPSARTKIPPAASYLPTTRSSSTRRIFEALALARAAILRARNENAGAGETQSFSAARLGVTLVLVPGVYS